MKNHSAAFSEAFSDNFLSYSCILEHFLMLKMAIDVKHLTKFNISIKFRFQIQFVMFLRVHPRTPIDPALVLLSGHTLLFEL